MFIAIPWVIHIAFLVFSHHGYDLEAAWRPAIAHVEWCPTRDAKIEVAAVVCSIVWVSVVGCSAVTLAQNAKRWDEGYHVVSLLLLARQFCSECLLTIWASVVDATAVNAGADLYETLEEPATFCAEYAFLINPPLCGAFDGLLWYFLYGVRVLPPSAPVGSNCAAPRLLHYYGLCCLVISLQWWTSSLAMP